MYTVRDYFPDCEVRTTVVVVVVAARYEDKLHTRRRAPHQPPPALPVPSSLFSIPALVCFSRVAEISL